ncbi:MAG: competence/damage-inducible protein A [Bacteroidetes bacterium]|nr:competence/damage-inducible protein A [Bacteroidota bacterium]
MTFIKASIITIGDELLIGQVIDTNSAWMAQELNKIGIAVQRRVAVGDERESILTTVKAEMAAADVVLVTGGLGPTADDITKPLLAEFFGGKLVKNEAVLNHVKYLFEKVYQREMSPRNESQALVPDTSTVLHNAEGTAPGMWFEKEGGILVSMPGVPFEMKALMRNEVMPRLQKKFNLPVILHRTLLTAGIGESALADRIQSFETNLPDHIKLAYLPHYGMVRLRLTASSFDEKALTKEMDTQFSQLQWMIEDVLVTSRDESMQEAVARLLLDNNSTMGTAESCTGGYIAHLLTSMAGASRYYKGSVVSYANEVKTDLLQVSEETLRLYGAVSEETVRQMAQAVLDNLHTDFALATSGIMGPDGGSPEKPVGTVWIAAGSRAGIKTIRLKLRFDRARNIELASFNALNFLRKYIKEQSFALKANSPA